MLHTLNIRGCRTNTLTFGITTSLTRNKSIDVLVKWKTAQKFTTNIGKVNSFFRENESEQRLTTFWFICTKVKRKIYFYWMCADGDGVYGINLNGNCVSEKEGERGRVPFLVAYILFNFFGLYARRFRCYNASVIV